MKQALFSVLKGSESFTKLLEGVKKERVVSVYGLSEGQRAYLASALHFATGRQVLLVMTSELASTRAAEDVSQLLDGSCAALPAQELEFGRGASSHESTWRRLDTLHRLLKKEVSVLCTSGEALMNRLMAPKFFLEATISLAPGDRFDPQALIDKLVKNGYERVSMVEGKGQCALRGAIVDVYPPSEPNALRIEFFDDEVDSIRTFDCMTQRSMLKLKDAVLPPASEVLVDGIDCKAAAQRMRDFLKQRVQEHADATRLYKELPPLPEDDDEELPSFFESSATEQKMPVVQAQTGSSLERLTAQSHEDADRLASGYPFRRMQNWVHVLCPETVSLISWLPEAIILIDQPDQLQDRIKGRTLRFEEDLKTALERGEAVGAQAGLLFDYGQVQNHISGRTLVTMSDFLRGMGSFNPGVLVEMNGVNAHAYQSNIRHLADDCLKWKTEGYCTALLTGGTARGKRLEKSLTEMDTPCLFTETLSNNLIIGEVLLLPLTLSKGFVWPEAKLALISDSDIYGAGYRKARTRRNTGERIAAFTDLNAGDYVVHETHGVGIYQGTIRIQSEGTFRDYLYIQYQGNDKLYVPTDQLDRVQRFIGAQGQAPKLNKLGGGEWQRQKAKVKAGIKAMAFDLLKLYGKRQAEKGYAFAKESAWQRQFEDNFPYELTPDQQQSITDITRDMETPMNMDRLLCGDVGYGKTEVALRAAFKAVMDNKQVALLAPTTILAQQHYNTILKRFSGFPVNCDVMSRFRLPKEQKEVLAKLKEGSVDIVVGTHRLLNKDVVFHDLGLLIVDEEQRFGVGHKEIIKNMKTTVDVLTLSATPIPRTLHMSMVGIRDMSILETPPEERFPVQTHVLEYADGLIRDAILRELSRGGQVYFLYNRVRSIEQFHARLKQLVPEARIAIAHGQMKENALEDVMMDFYDGTYDVLLCTTIIESGLDIPTANTLIVFDADRFGLSQLYQLRGRVGRSNRQAYAYFTVRPDRMISETAQKRLSAIREFTEFGAGFRIAMRDLEIRGAGNILGPEQHGHLSTVGYDMYCKLIEETIREVRGDIGTAADLDTRIELKVNAFLPADYVPDERQRMEIYKRISMLEDRAGREDIEEELVDRFGDTPEAVNNLLDIAHLKALCRRLGIIHVTHKGFTLSMRLDEKHVPDPLKLINALGQTDKRLILSAAKTPALLFKDVKLTVEQMLPLAVKLLEKVVALIGDSVTTAFSKTNE